MKNTINKEKSYLLLPIYIIESKVRSSLCINIVSICLNLFLSKIRKCKFCRFATVPILIVLLHTELLRIMARFPRLSFGKSFIPQNINDRKIFTGVIDSGGSLKNIYVNSIMSNNQEPKDIIKTY